MALLVATAPAGTRGLGTARRRRMAARTANWRASLFPLCGGSSSFRLSGGFGGPLRFLFGGDLGFFGCSFLGFAILFGTAALFFALLDLRTVLALTRFLRQAEAIFF